MKRREFLQTANLGAMACLGVCGSTAAAELPSAPSPQADGPAMKLRPYQLLCLVCSAKELMTKLKLG